MKKRYFDIAAKAAEKTNNVSDYRGYYLGCFGIRSDGSTVISKNISISYCPNDNNEKIKRRNPFIHAEGRAIKKIGKNARVLYIARISRLNGDFAMAKPCSHCQTLIKAFLINKVYYTIDVDRYGLFIPEEQKFIESFF